MKRLNNYQNKRRPEFNFLRYKIVRGHTSRIEKNKVAMKAGYETIKYQQ